MSRILSTFVIIGLAMGGTAACATKGFVRTHVDEVNQKVDTLSGTVEETQERTRRNEAEIGQVGQRADAAGQAAQAAGTAAGDARQAADRVGGRVDDVEAAARRLIYEVVISEEQGNFQFNQTALPEGARPELDALVDRLKQSPQAAWIEIEGHTDSTGPKEINMRIGLERAESVKRYLYQEHQVPLHKMNVISYGPDQPVAPNATRDGRAQNRRVVIRVVS